MGLLLLILHGITTPQAWAVPRSDPDQTGLDQEQPFSYKQLLDPTQQKVVFSSIGQFAMDVTFAHQQLHIPFDMYLDMHKTFEKGVNRIQAVAETFHSTAKSTKEEVL